MNPSLRHKIIGANLLVLVLTFLVIYLVVIDRLNTINETMLVDSLKHQAEMSVIFIKQTLLNGEKSAATESDFQAHAGDFAVKLARESGGTEVLVFSVSKNLIAYSSSSTPVPMEYSELEEVLKGNRTYITRQQNSSRHLFFTFPVMPQGKVIGEIMFVSPMNEMDKSAGAIQMLFAIAFIAALLITLIISIFLSRKITHPLLTLERSATEIANGNFKNKITLHSSDEVGTLAKTFNQMSCEIENRINIIDIEKKKLNSIVESMGEGVIAFNDQDEIIAVNSQAKTLLNLLLDSEIQKAVLKVKEYNSRVILETNQDEKSILICGTPLQLSETSGGAVLILNDITELRLLQEKQRQFVTNVSHELKTPLTTIVGYIELLQSKGSDRQIYETSVHYLQSASERLLRLVDDLLDLSMLSKFQFEVEPKSTNLSELIQDVVGQMTPKAQKFNHQIKTYIPQTRDILIDPARIKQALVNILDNSIKYSEGSEIRIILSEDEESLCLQIEDNGCGIPPETLDKIFDPFYRIDKDRSRTLGGNGLGLSITKEIVEKHQGSIQIESTVNEGTKVMITLPK